MRELADDVWMLSGFPPNAINVYLLGDVVVDAGTRFAKRRILRQVRGRQVNAHALTHAHADHQGASKAICEALGVPLWCGAGDVHAMETPGGLRAAQPSHPLNTLIDAVWTGPPRKVDRALHEGDEVAGFTVLETPGHSAGHVSFWRESDRTLICGDVLNGMNLLTSVTGLHEPPEVFTPDPATNRESIRRLAALEPALVCFGHGPPMRNPAQLTSFAATLR
jgi:glyoxylase-like metal-dependent hydrolase (beta-lactamase superfamily II)